MPRDASIPLFLWIATAVLVHLIWGGGADRVAHVIEDRLDVGRFAASVQQRVRNGVAPPIEVSLEDDSETPQQPPEAKPEETPEEPREPAPAKPENADKDEALREKERERPQEKDEEKEKEREKEKEPEERKAELEKKEPIRVPELELPKRIAVRQFVEDQNQEDNPNARHLADHANHVEQETQARITSNTENAPEPHPGSSPTGAGEQAGNATETRVAQDRDAPGEARAPDETPSSPRIAKLDPARAPPPTRGGAPRVAPEPSPPPEQGQKAQAASEERAGAPETLSSEESTGFSVAEQQAPSAEQKAQEGRKARELPRRQSRKPTDMLGLGAAGVTANGVNLNMTPSIAAASIGMDELSRLRRSDGERRRSAHRGKFKIGGIERWRSAIENYVPSVKPGNQTALNTARAPFASYLSTIHNRLHPIFADGFLASLDALPGSHPMNQPDLSTNLEIVLDQEEGRIVKMGVTKFSGVTAFDVAALESVSRAAPFGTPPSDIVSPDGNVYLHWEFHRNVMACSTYNARPFMLKVQPKSAPPGPLAPPALPPLRPGEPPPGSEQHGSLGTQPAAF
jgi:hypothetical protein